MANGHHLKKAKRVLDIEIAALQRVRRRLGTSFLRAIQLMRQRLENGGKIIVTGIGKSGHIGHKIAATLASTGTTSVALDPVDAAHGDLGVVSPKDLVMVLSYSGNTDELLRVVPLLKRLGTPIVGITGNLRSPLAKQSDIALDVSVDQEACPLNLAPTSSTTAMLAIGDAIAMVLLESRGFRREDFARLHPGGAIGRDLLLKVSEIMRPRSAVPLCKPDTSVAKAPGPDHRETLRGGGGGGSPRKAPRHLHPWGFCPRLPEGSGDRTPHAPGGDDQKSGHHPR